MIENPSWSHWYRARREIRARYRRIGAAPRLGDAEELVRRHGAPGDLGVLDFGAGDRAWRERLAALGYPARGYRSVDRQPAFGGAGHDFSTVHELSGAFGTILLFEVVEHLLAGEVVPLLGELRRRLSAGGRLLVTTPNGHHPTRWREDPTHRSMWTFESLGAALLLAGFEQVRLYRLWNGPLWQGPVIAALLPALRVLRVDFAPGLAAAAW